MLIDISPEHITSLRFYIYCQYRYNEEKLWVSTHLVQSSVLLASLPMCQHGKNGLRHHLKNHTVKYRDNYLVVINLISISKHIWQGLEGKVCLYTPGLSIVIPEYNHMK